MVRGDNPVSRAAPRTRNFSLMCPSTIPGAGRPPQATAHDGRMIDPLRLGVPEDGSLAGLQARM